MQVFYISLPNVTYNNLHQQWQIKVQLCVWKFRQSRWKQPYIIYDYLKYLFGLLCNVISLDFTVGSVCHVAVAKSNHNQILSTELN